MRSVLALALLASSALAFQVPAPVNTARTAIRVNSEAPAAAAPAPEAPKPKPAPAMSKYVNRMRLFWTVACHGCMVFVVVSDRPIDFIDRSIDWSTG